MSLKGAAAADTARAFSRLRGRAGTSAATTHPPSPPASRPTSLEGKPATDAALPEEAAGPAHWVRQAGRVSLEAVLSWTCGASNAESSTAEAGGGVSSSRGGPPWTCSRSAQPGRWGRPVHAAGRSLSEASSHTQLLLCHPSSQRETGISEAPEALDSPGIPVPQSAF